MRSTIREIVETIAEIIEIFCKKWEIFANDYPVKRYLKIWNGEDRQYPNLRNFWR